MRIIKTRGFTLAEVLITLGIIGIIASITIHTLLNDINDKQTVTAVKKAYTILSQAYKMAEMENGDPINWFTGAGIDVQNRTAVLGTIIPYLKVSKNCNTSGQDGCFETHRLLSGGAWGAGPYGYSLVLDDGMDLQGWLYAPVCNDDYTNTNNLALNHVCAYYFVDINGFKGPNQLGKDTFLFYLTKYGIIPSGLKDEVGGDGFSFDSDCKDINGSGYSCTAWSIYNENLDYTKACRASLSWSGPTSCN